jgi:Tol biopolymer transport system component
MVTAAAGLLALGVAGCGQKDRVVGFTSAVGASGGSGVATTDATVTDATVTDATTDASTVLGPFGAPVAIDGLLATADLVQDPSLSTDELELYFASEKAGATEGYDIWLSTRTAVTDPWGVGSMVAELSTAKYDDLEPEVSADDLTMYFSSDRPGPEADTHIWIAQRQRRTDPWGAPVQFKLTGTSMAARGPAVDDQQLEMVFYSDGAQGDYDLYRITRASVTDAWGAPASLTEVNSTVFDWDPALFLDGRGLIFGSRRNGDKTGPSDLFETSQTSPTSPFATPRALTPLNSKSSEGDPWLSNDGRHIVFSSDRSGTTRLYEAFR